MKALRPSLLLALSLATQVVGASCPGPAPWAQVARSRSGRGGLSDAWRNRFIASHSSPEAYRAMMSYLGALDRMGGYEGHFRDVKLADEALRGMSRADREALASEILAKYPSYAAAHSHVGDSPKRVADLLLRLALDPAASVEESIRKGMSAREAFAHEFKRVRSQLPARNEMMGAYSAEDVLRTAEAMQVELRKLGDPNARVTMGGSFPNGLARLGDGSDVDIAGNVANRPNIDYLMDEGLTNAMPGTPLMVDQVHHEIVEPFQRISNGMAIEITPDRIRLVVSKPGVAPAPYMNPPYLNPEPPQYYDLSKP
jgi:hypothetical protein